MSAIVVQVDGASVRTRSCNDELSKYAFQSYRYVQVLNPSAKYEFKSPGNNLQGLRHASISVLPTPPIYSLSSPFQPALLSKPGSCKKRRTSATSHCLKMHLFRGSCLGCLCPGKADCALDKGQPNHSPFSLLQGRQLLCLC